METTARALGAYYTPRPLASLLTRWAIRSSGDTVLDPSCGEGVFLAESVNRLLERGTRPRDLGRRIAGIEIDPRSLARAQGALLSRHPALRWNRLLEDDFFSYAEKHTGSVTFDAVVGNPPFLRNQGRSPEEKRFALRVAAAAGVELTGDASLWAPFVAAAVSFLRPGGRFAMIIPREAFFVRYARPLLDFLQRRFAVTRMIALEGFHFTAREKVAFLLCEGTGPGTLVQEEVSSVADLDLETPPVPSTRTWIHRRIPDLLRNSVDRALSSPHLVSLSNISTVLLGVVTGDRRFFVRERAGSLPGRFLLPVVTRPSQLPGSVLRKGETDAHLLAIPPEYGGGCAALDDLLEEGVTRGTPRAYKCRTRKPWYSLARVGSPPDGFLGYLVKRRLRCASNLAGAQSTNNVHRVWFPDSLRRRRSALMTSWLNAVTALSAELTGRIYGGGVLKLEPGEVQKLRVPNPDRITGLPVRKIDALLRRGDTGKAWMTIDEETSRILDLPPSVVQDVRRAAEVLRDIRLGIRSVSGDAG